MMNVDIPKEQYRSGNSVNRMVWQRYGPDCVVRMMDSILTQYLTSEIERALKRLIGP